MDFPHGETVTRLRGTPVIDPYSEEATGLNWDGPASLELLCGVADGGSIEPSQDARDSVASDFDVLAPYGADVTPADRLVVRGLTCEVVGRPFAWLNPLTGWTAGTLVRAKIVEG